jgi:hypothetical protein
MTREYVLAPFAPENKDLEEEEGRNGTWTASTTLYSLDLNCTTPRLEPGKPTILRDGTIRQPTLDETYLYVGMNDCEWPYTFLDNIGNETIGVNPLSHPDAAASSQAVFNTKKFSAYFVGYYSTDYSTWYLENLCPKTANHTW